MNKRKAKRKTSKVKAKTTKVVRSMVNYWGYVPTIFSFLALTLAIATLSYVMGNNKNTVKNETFLEVSKAPTPTPENTMVYANKQFGYSLKIDKSLEAVDETKYSALFYMTAGNTKRPKFPSIYISVVPENYSNKDNLAYNYLDKDLVNGFFEAKTGEVRQIKISANPGYWMYEKLGEMTVDGEKAVVTENNYIWDGDEGLKDRRVLIKRNGLNYVIGGYYHNQSELNKLDTVLKTFNLPRVINK